ncbi:2-oxoacid:ferredoxin oxidoreductase subunit beta [Legionella longbeachae]|uniref:Putative Simiar to 2-oxoglutarate ferredoxin oxidoreductase beta subunit n=1 Tax=Legionella longbeachae serogroup 1 (strain NSW150) TaxID=661367 RepID=D3HIV2_LEGLN|nr:2-oxoacid:ferredoxin oxidoreductase subunit beta [Legionella longbeachae]VEE02840.1 2-oxoglutarate ferredoxin oxidoreductase subunit beta [Legionella oakridgensis]HBD7398015.1 2-oxoacid:ferredoxin oxidoreductase subunit beta [Legionella pneumophila]ARB90916.1 2-oxoacid:ferredoxin oxidoreductase subunit beta [Legionella longbeachae]ARM32652.1 2-oxoacid:ferredoxin oxidoreductase subunit beta [Legionella longbeachae]EEZ94570.1 2-oxoglutarate ferrodoxin oxidoreductase beta subunit [Legionella l
MNKNLKREDFTNATEVRWCPGCGDYAILMALQKMLPELGLPPEQHVFISGIGCAGRLPYYMNTYGFHTIHGRATAVATGLKATRDDLSVWVITGDGDALSIGGNHLIHILRRNVNVNILLFNNQVYGLTKGQFSPTSQKGQITKTSPKGVINEPVNPLALALASGASFVARAVDKDPQHLGLILKKAHEHPGCSFVEIYQDCNIFNHGAFDEFALKNNRVENTVILEEGQPLLYGLEQEKALHRQGDEFVCISNSDKELYQHDPSNFIAAMQLASLSFPAYPVPLGIYYQKTREVFSLEQTLKKTVEDLPDLFKTKDTWSHT